MATESVRSVLLIVPEEGLLFEATGIADIFHWANQGLGDSAQPRYQLVVATTLKYKVAHGRSGLSLIADQCLADLNPAESWDTIIVTGRGTGDDERRAVADWVTLAEPRCRRVVSVCAGALILAQTGLLDGRRATTHWLRTDLMRQLYPAVKVEDDPIFVNDGKFWTSAGASSGFDLALALVEDDLGFLAAKTVAQNLVLFLRRPGGQSQFSQYLAHQASEPGPIRDVQAWAIDHLDQDLAVEKLADRAAMSPRNFARVFAHQTGVTPAKFVEQIRLNAARQRLEQGRETLDQVAAACGLGSALTLRRTFEKFLGVTPSDYRVRFGRI